MTSPCPSARLQRAGDVNEKERWPTATGCKDENTQFEFEIRICKTTSLDISHGGATTGDNKANAGASSVLLSFGSFSLELKHLKVAARA